MAEDILRRYAVGGAQRPDSFSGLTPEFQSSLVQLFSGASPEIQNVLRISSAYRSPQRQAELWQGALAKYGSEAAARKWVAPPGRSNHNHGQAVDLKYLDPSALDYVRQNAQKYGLHLPLSNENWHIEPIGARGGQPKVMPAAAGGPAQPMSLGQSFGDPALTQTPMAPAQPNMSMIAQMFVADEQTKQRQALEAQAEKTRRAALFGGPSPFG